VFILVNNEEQNIPIQLVMQAQRLGKWVKWVAADKEGHLGFLLHITFLMGGLHQKAPEAIEFAVLSDDAAYDPLVEFINESGRNCIRVKTRKGESPIVPDDHDDEEDKRPEPVQKFRVSA
jgi:hypothetical protein